MHWDCFRTFNILDSSCGWPKYIKSVSKDIYANNYMMNYEWMSWNCNSTPQKIECAKIKSHYESIADLLLNHGDACNRILFGYKRSFFRRLPEKTICFSFAHRCSLQTSFSSLFGWRSVCVCVGGVVVIWVILILKFSEALILIVEENDSFCVAFWKLSYY